MANGSILHIVASTDRRGAETFAVDLSARLAALGWRSETVALAPGRSGGLDLESVGDAPLSLRTLQRLRRRTRSSNVVVAHGSTTLPACALALSGSGRPFVYRNIGDPHHWATSRLRRLRTAAFLARASRIVALNERSGTALRELYRVPPRKLTAIPTGVSSGSHLPASPEQRAAARLGLGIGSSTTVVLAVGALSSEKGVDLAIDALVHLGDAFLVVAGDGPELAALRAPGRSARCDPACPVHRESSRPLPPVLGGRCSGPSEPDRGAPRGRDRGRDAGTSGRRHRRRVRRRHRRGRRHGAGGRSRRSSSHRHGDRRCARSPRDG